MTDIKKWKRQKVAFKDVKPMPDNPRQIAKVNLAALKASMSRFGYVEPIVWNKTTGHIVGGHQRFSVLSAAGVEEATMVVVEMSPEDELAANLTLNNPAIEGEWDDTAADIMEQVESAVPDLAESLRIDELKKFVAKMAPKIDDGGNDDMPIVEDKPDTTCPCCGYQWKIQASDVTIYENLDDNAPPDS